MFLHAFQCERRGCACDTCVLARCLRAIFAILLASCLGSSFELDDYLRRFGKPITMFFHVVSVAARDYAFEKSRYDPGGGLAAAGHSEVEQNTTVKKG